MLSILIHIMNLEKKQPDIIIPNQQKPQKIYYSKQGTYFFQNVKQKRIFKNSENFTNIMKSFAPFGATAYKQQEFGSLLRKMLPKSKGKTLQTLKEKMSMVQV